jgi:hypothetical protein
MIVVEIWVGRGWVEVGGGFVRGGRVVGGEGGWERDVIGRGSGGLRVGKGRVMLLLLMAMMDRRGWMGYDWDGGSRRRRGVLIRIVAGRDGTAEWLLLLLRLTLLRH